MNEVWAPDHSNTVQSCGCVLKHYRDHATFKPCPKHVAVDRLVEALGNLVLPNDFPEEGRDYVAEAISLLSEIKEEK